MPRRPIAEIHKDIAKLRAKANKEAKGAPVISAIAEVPNTYFLRRPCGIMPLDIDTGGGLPAGGLCYISGPDNGGKTYLTNKYIAFNQRLLGDRSAVAIGLSEGPPDHWFMRKCGVRVAIPDSMIEERNKYMKEQGLKPFTKEEVKELKSQTGHIEIIRHSSGEKLLQTIVDAVETKAFDLVVLDSVSALISENEAGKDLDENTQAQAIANALTRFFQHYLTNTTGFYGSNETSVIFTAQARSNKKKSEAAAHFARYMKDWTTQGAWAARHGKLIDITVWSGGKEKTDTKFDGLLGEKGFTKGVAQGKEINWEIMKGKAGTHDGITGEIDFSYDTLTDDYRSIVISGMRAGCIFEKDGKFSVIRKATGEVHAGLDAIADLDTLMNLMKEDFEMELFIRKEVLASRGIQCTYR